MSKEHIKHSYAYYLARDLVRREKVRAVCKHEKIIKVCLRCGLDLLRGEKAKAHVKYKVKV